MRRTTIPEEEYMLPGHSACLGCGGALAMRYLLKGLGKNTIISIPACCWAVIPGVYPSRCLEVPLLYTAFEVTGAAISGIADAMEVLGKDVNVVGFAGDGGTVDIGLQALSGMLERRHNAIYVLYDNEAYMNTGIQRSGATPYGAWTTTTPVGKRRMFKREHKKDIMEIVVAHEIPYAATLNIAYPEDFIKKVKKAKEIKGPKFLHIYAPCPTGWRYPPNKTVEVARLATETLMFPLYEVEEGVYTITKKIKEPKPVKEYLKTQGRFRYLSDEDIEIIQKWVNHRWKKLLLKEKYSRELLEE